MNKKLNNNFSLKKLLLTALVSGPLATLPAPLWALPDITAANLTTSAGVTTQLVGANTLNVTSPDKAILTWQAFGSVGTGSITNSTIGANDIINYFLPTASGSVLNTVSGGVGSTINGQILSNGNVYILNPAGIVISPTAQINVGGFYASTVSEPSGFFAINGTLSYAGTSNSNVVVQGTGVTGGTDTAQIQAVGTGNNIYLAGQAVDVQGGKFFGNLFVRASNASGTIAGMGGNNVRFGETGPVSINLVGAALTGGGLNITSNGGNVKLTGGTQATLTAALASTPVGTLTTIATGTGGTGYNPPPVVTISAPNAGGVQATATARVNAAGLVEGYTIVNAGSGYNGLTPTASITVTGTGTNNGAGVAIPVVTGDFISAITPSATQTGYAPSPAVTITPVGGVGTGASATAIINTSGAISSYAITAAGSGYTSAPTVTVTGTAAPGAAGITLAGVGLAAVTGQSQGSNYGTAVPSVTFSGGGGTGGIATATLTNGVVTGYSIVSAGSGYTSAPTVAVSAPTNGSLTLAPNVASTKGALTIDTNGNGVQGSITQGASAITASTSGQTLALNAGAGGNITLGAIDALTIGATGNNISVTDTAGDLTLNATTAAGSLTVVGAGSILQGSGTHSITGAITLTPAASKTVTFTGAGDLTFASIGSTSTITISTPGNITFNQATLTATQPLSITSTGGTITAGAISSGSTLTISATSAAGRLTATSLRSNTGTVTVTGDISGVGAGSTAIINGGGSTLAITTTAGNMTLGAITASSTLNLTATAGTISAGAISSVTLNISAPLGTVTTSGTLANTNTAVITSGSVTLAGITSTSSLTVTASTGNLSATTISTTSTLSLNAPSVTGTILTNGITATGTNAVSLSSGGTLNVAGGATPAAVTVPVLNLTSTAGSITQAAAITSTSTVTINTFADATLTTATNDFNTVVLKGGAGGTTGTQVTDRNAINIGGGTTALGNVTITAGAGILTYGTSVPTVTLSPTPILLATSTATISNGSVATLPVTVAGGGYITAPTVTIAAPVNNANPAGLVRATATATINSLTGLVTGYTITNAGSGYTSVPTVTVGAATGTLTTLTGVLSGGALSSVTVNPGTAPYSAAPTVTIGTAIAGGASATAAISAIGAVSGVTPSQSGTITLGSAAIDVLSFAQNLTLTTSGIAGGTLTPIYSGLTTGANSVTVLGNVSLTGAGTAFNLGANTFGSAANYNFGQINAGLTTGALTINETQTVNLGTITAGSLDARSVGADIVNTGKLAVTGNTVLAANSIFNPGDVTLNFATNALSGPVLIGNARDFSLTNTVNTTVTAGTTLVNGKAATGAVNVTVTGAGNTLTLNTAAGGDYSTVGFNTAGVVSITDGSNGITLQNATSTGTGAVGVSAAGPIVLGSGIALNTTGVTTITSTGASASITDSAPGIRIVGNVNLASDAQIAITQAGHSLGAVGLVTTGATGGVANASANITYTEGGTANLNVVSVNSSGLATAGGVLNVVSTGGSIIQTPATGSIAIATTANVAAGSATLSSVGDVTLTNPAGTNNIAGPIVISAVGNVSIAQAQNIILGNTSVSAGTFSADNSFGVAKTITQAAGTTAKIYGASTFTTQTGKITLTNTDGTGNNFGAVSARTTFINGADAVGAAAGADIAILEAGTLNLAQVKAGTAGKLTAISSAADIMQSSTGGISVGGATALTSAGNISLNLAGTSNSFGGAAGISITAPGVVSIQDAATTTALAGGTTIGGALTLKNNAAGLNGQIRDLPGTIVVRGDVWFDTGTNAASSVTIGSSNITLGAVKFNSGTVTIVENDNLTIAPGSVASGPVSLTSSGNIITSGAGGGTFQNTLTLNATGSITVTNPIFVVGAGTSGLVFRALGAVNLGALSLAGNLNGIAPTSLGSSSYTPPSP